MSTKTVQNASVDELLAEIERRKASGKLAEAATAGRECSVSPVGAWRVTTEGDCEGKTVRELGVYRGHVADIAAVLANQAYYTLTFHPETKVVAAPVRPVEVTVNVALDISTGHTWDMKPNERVEFFRMWLGKAPTKEYALSVSEGQYYASVNLDLKRK